MLWAIGTVAILSVIYFLLLDSYRERSMSEQAAKVLMQGAEAQEEFFKKEHQYFDAEASGNGGTAYLTTPDGKRTSVRIPTGVVLSFKARGKDRKTFTGHAFYTGSKFLHRYDSESGKMTTVSRVQQESG
jgi:Tfp pilus assembly protein PilE